MACACVVLQTRRPVTANFWTNVNDSRFAIPGVIEMSNLRHLQGHIAYAPFYIPADHPDYQRPNEAFIADAWACFKAINPQLSDTDLLASHCSRYLFAQPVCGVNFQASLPPLQPFLGSSSQTPPRIIRKTEELAKALISPETSEAGGGNASEILCKRMKTSSGRQFQLFVLTGGAAAVNVLSRIGFQCCSA